MFYFDNFYGQKVLKSDYLDGITAFFTTRDWKKFNHISKPILTPTQTHSDNVEIIDTRTEYPNTDGLILSTAEKCCYLRFADCTPLIFYDPIKKIGAISHAGWRGTAAKIAIKTIEKMGSNPEDITAVIGPAIGLCCYEVSDEVKNKLLSTVKNTSNLYTNRNVDLKGINAEQLAGIGVKKIDICPYCTSCDNDLFYSYRKENGTDKRHYAFLSLSRF